MNKKTEFLEKLKGLVQLARTQGSRITAEEVKAYFTEDALTKGTLSPEQMTMIFEYLLSQGVAVKGYVQMGEDVTEPEFSEEELIYLREYEQELKRICPEAQGEREMLYGQIVCGNEDAKGRLAEVCLPMVLELAKELDHPDVFIGDLIQEGNLGLVMGIEMLAVEKPEQAEDWLREQIQQSMQMLLAEQTDLKTRDKKMVEKVQSLDDSIQELTEELGRKVALEEIAIHMGMEIEEVEAILKLAGEDADFEEEEK